MTIEIGKLKFKEGFMKFFSFENDFFFLYYDEIHGINMEKNSLKLGKYFPELEKYDVEHLSIFNFNLLNKIEFYKHESILSDIISRNINFKSIVFLDQSFLILPAEAVENLEKQHLLMIRGQLLKIITLNGFSTEIYTLPFNYLNITYPYATLIELLIVNKCSDKSILVKRYYEWPTTIEYLVLPSCLVDSLFDSLILGSQSEIFEIEV